MPLDRETLGRLQALHEIAEPPVWEAHRNGIIYGPDDGQFANQIVDGSCGRVDDRELIVELRNAAPDLLAAAALGLAVQEIQQKIAELGIPITPDIILVFKRDLLALLDAPAGAR